VCRSRSATKPRKHENTKTQRQNTTEFTADPGTGFTLRRVASVVKKDSGRERAGALGKQIVYGDRSAEDSLLDAVPRMTVG